MNQAHSFIRRRWLLAALLFIPAIARADPDYGGLFGLLLVALAVGVVLTAGFVWIFVADYRAGQPGIGFGNAIVTMLLGMVWLGASVQHWSWLTPVLMGLLGLNGWLLARKNIRVATQYLVLWLAVGIMGVGWLAGALLSLWLQFYPYTWQWLGGRAAFVWPLISLALQLPGLVVLARAFFARWPTEWPTQTLLVGLQAAGIVAAVDAGFYLVELLATSAWMSDPADIWRFGLPGLLQSIVISLLEVTLVLLVVRAVRR